MDVQLSNAQGAAVLAPAPHVAHEEHHHDDAGSKVTLGFWIYLMSDCILFAAVFATFVVLRGRIADGPSGREIFDLPYVGMETACLLVSSFTYGLAMIFMGKGQKNAVLAWLGVTLALGLTFMGLEIHEFTDLIAQGFGPQRSAFLSALFTLVGTHGAHVSMGMIWMVVLMAHILRRGLSPANQVRLMCLSLFWHFLDIVWIGVFTIVYLTGAAH